MADRTHEQPAISRICTQRLCTVHYHKNVLAGKMQLIFTRFQCLWNASTSRVGRLPGFMCFSDTGPSLWRCHGERKKEWVTGYAPVTPARESFAASTPTGSKSEENASEMFLILCFRVQSFPTEDNWHLVSVHAKKMTNKLTIRIKRNETLDMNLFWVA